MSSTISGHSFGQSSLSSRDQRTKPDQSDRESLQLWYRVPPKFETNGPYSFRRMMQWYNDHMINPLSQISTDDRLTWQSIVELRCRNGPFSPFVPNNTDRLQHPMDSLNLCRRKIIEDHECVEELEKQCLEMSRDLAVQENNLDQMIQMEKMHAKEMKKMKTRLEEQYLKVGAKKEKPDGQRKPRKARAKNGKSQQPEQKDANNSELPPNQDANGFEQPPQAEPPVEEDQREEEPNDGPPEPVPVVEETLGPLALFPMLQTSTYVNDYHAAITILPLLRGKFERGVSDKVLAATKDTFSQPPTCTVCPEAQPLKNIVEFLEHVLSDNHNNMIVANNGFISSQQCFFWIEILANGTTKRSPV